MRVLHVIDSLHPAGAETLLCELADFMQELNIESEIYILRQTGSRLESECRRKGIAVHHASTGNLYSPRQLIDLQSHLRRHQYEIIHSHLFPAQLWAALASKLVCPDTPLITTEHNTANRRRKPYWKPFDKWMYGKYDAFVGVSEAVSVSLSHWIADRPHPAQTIYNGVRRSRIAEIPAANLKAELGITGHILAISVGRCELPKNYGFTLRALAQVGLAGTPALHWAIVGDGTLLPELRVQAGQLGIESRVHFLGHRADVISLLKDADFYVQASLWEGFSMAVIEGLAVGLPMIVARIESLTEAVGEAGFTFAPGNETELADCLSILSNDPDQRARMSLLSLQRASHFDLAETSARYADLYRSLQRVPAPAASPVLL